MTPYEQLKQLCGQNPRPARLLIVCPDIVRRTRALEFVINSLCKDSNSLSLQNIALQKYDAASLNSETVRNLRESSMNLSLFSSQKFIVLKDIDKTPASVSKELEQILSSKDTSNTFICSASSVSTKTLLLKAFDKSTVVTFNSPEGAELLKWVSQELKRQGCSEANPKVTQLIAAMGTEDLDSIAALIEKIALYSDGDKISVADIQALDTFQEKVQEFNFVNLIASGKKTAALAYVDQLIKAESNLFPLIGLLSKMFSNYLRIKLAKKTGSSDAVITKELGLSPWAYKKQSEIAASCNELKLIRAVKAITRADSQIKNKNLSESAVLTELVSNAT